MTTNHSAPPTDARLAQAVESASAALLEMGRRDPILAAQLARLVTAIAEESARSRRLTHALTAALATPDDIARGTSREAKPRAAKSSSVNSGRARASHRRKPGPWDPFAVFAEVGADGLRERLMRLELEQLRDIVAEHGMDADKLAMKWKDTSRVVERIVDRVMSRSEKGSAFRGGD